MIPEVRRQEELPRLRPVKVFPDTLALRFPIFVGPTAEVTFEGTAYSMPPEATHVAGTLFLYRDRVRIVAGRFEVEHWRRSKHDPPAPLPQHRAAKIAAVHGARAKLYEKRQQVLNLGPDALVLLTELTHREPLLSKRRVEELFALLEEHGDAAIHQAISKAVGSGKLSVAGVRHALSAQPVPAHAASAQVSSRVVSDEAPLRRVVAKPSGGRGAVEGRAATSEASLPSTASSTRGPTLSGEQPQEPVQLPLAFKGVTARRRAT